MKRNANSTGRQTNSVVIAGTLRTTSMSHAPRANKAPRRAGEVDQLVAQGIQGMRAFLSAYES